MDEVIDITLIGSGIAASITMVEVLSSLLNTPGTQKVSIAVIEKTDELWKGIPYGSRSSVNALTITTVYDFINEKEAPLFFKWLKDTKDTWSSYYRDNGGITAERWLKNNLPLIEKEDWETVFIPRFIFGNYMKEKLGGLLKVVHEEQLAEIKLIRAEAIDLKVIGTGLHEIIIEYPDKTLSSLQSRKVVISTGSAPVRKMCEPPGDKAVYVNDIYDPSVDDNIKTLQTALSKTNDAGDRNVLIIGSNASSIEFLYLLEGLPALRKLINKVVIISPSGALPIHISTDALDSHPIPNLDKVRAAGNYTIKSLYEAADQDLKLALQHGANMDYVATVVSNALNLLEVLDEYAKKEFFGIYAIKLRDKFRRSGPEYKGISELLIDKGEVTILKGKFINTDLSENGVLFNYLDTATGQQKTYPLSFKAIINCSGSDDLNESSSRLLRNMVNNHICKMNLSRKGIEVNEKFEAAHNLYVMGPLLGGNMNKLIHFWQLENASRLTYLAPYLAKELLDGSV